MISPNDFIVILFYVKIVYNVCTRMHLPNDTFLIIYPRLYLTHNCIVVKALGVRFVYIIIIRQRKLFSQQ